MKLFLYNIETDKEIETKGYEIEEALGEFYYLSEGKALF